MANKQLAHGTHRPADLKVGDFFLANEPEVNDAIARDLRLKAGSVKVLSAELGTSRGYPTTAYLLIEVGGRAMIAPTGLQFVRPRDPNEEDPINMRFQAFPEGLAALSDGFDRAPLEVLKAAGDADTPEAMQYRRVCLARGFSSGPMNSIREFSAVFVPTDGLVLVPDYRAADAYSLSGDLISLPRAKLGGAVAMQLPTSTEREIEAYEPPKAFKPFVLTLSHNSKDRHVTIMVNRAAYEHEVDGLAALGEAIRGSIGRVGEWGIHEAIEKLTALRPKVEARASEMISRIIPLCARDPHAEAALGRRFGHPGATPAKLMENEARFSA